MGNHFHREFQFSSILLLAVSMRNEKIYNCYEFLFVHRKGTLIYVGTQDQCQPKPEVKSNKSITCSFKEMKSFKRIFSVKTTL